MSSVAGTGAAQVANNPFLVEECAGKRCSECGTDGEVAAVACDCFHGPVSDFSDCVSYQVFTVRVGWRDNLPWSAHAVTRRTPGWFCVDAGAWTGHSTTRTEQKDKVSLSLVILP